MTPPALLIASPPCTYFSILQNLNARTERGANKIRKQRREAMLCLNFCAEACRLQSENGGTFVLEHPRTARSWKESSIRELSKQPGVWTIDFDMCAFGLRLEGAHKKSKKPTRILTNSEDILKLTSGKVCQCRDGHHVLFGGIAKLAQVYPSDFCRALVLGARREIEAEPRWLEASGATCLPVEAEAEQEEDPNLRGE